MSMNKIVPYIDMEKTGNLLKKKITGQGYMVKDIQEYLQLACPQPIYRWYKGKMLPSIDNLLMLSRLLGVHMEELLVLSTSGQEQEIKKNIYIVPHCELQEVGRQKAERRGFSVVVKKYLLVYWRKLYDCAA